ncbi:MAG: Type 1 glutamine amidotransferase-like domain-containing protein [Patescibacteria group bacterium]
MKLLLTSGGITNKSIERALFELVGKKAEEISVVFVPTASNVEMGDKSWFIKDLVYLQSQNFKSIDIADISAVEEKIWKPKFEQADVIYVEGGNTFHLMEWISKSGLASLLPKYLETKVYVGVSAGSMVASPDLALKVSQEVYEEDLDQHENMSALGFVDFYFLPHYNSPSIKKSEAYIRESAKDMKAKIYVLDDESAIRVVDGEVEVISEGKWFEIN